VLRCGSVAVVAAVPVRVVVVCALLLAVVVAAFGC